MKEEQRAYIAIDLKSFYASVECVERGLDPLSANLVVADASRTNKTICLAVTPSLKAYGISGRARLFEVVSKAKEHNLTYITAVPRMALYMEYSTKIYNIYLRYVAPEDIHVYSIDEVFMDVTHYLKTYSMTAKELARKMINEVLAETGITATAGIAPNMFLCKVAMDIVAKHIEADEKGVRIACLSEKEFREKLWGHTPITDFWRVGRGFARKLAEQGMYTMGDVARCSLGDQNDYYNEDLLYKMFGVEAEILIDHAWGYEPCTIDYIKAYKPDTKSMGQGQVLHYPYDFAMTRNIVMEMIDNLMLELVDKGYMTNQMVLTIGYDIENLTNQKIASQYKGEITVDRYGRKVPKHAHGTANLGKYTSSTNIATKKVIELFDKIVDERLLVRRVNIAACNLIKNEEVKEEYTQLELFEDYAAKEKEEEKLAKENNMQKAILDIKKKYGKNAIIRGINVKEGATAQDRNRQIGGHKA